MRKSKSVERAGSFDGRNVTRREFLESAVMVVGGGLFSDEALEASPLHGSPARYLSGDRIAATPTYLYRAYRSKGSPVAEAVSWVRIDLGARKRIDAVRIYPANQHMVPGKDAYYGGEGFPVRFKLEASDQEDFHRAKAIVDLTDSDFPNPEDHILEFPGKGISARYVRLTVTKFPNPMGGASAGVAPGRLPDRPAGGDYYYALSKIGVRLGQHDIAAGRTVTADATYGNRKDLAQLTRPDRIETEYIRHDRPQNVTPPSAWRRAEFAAIAPLSGVALKGGVFETAMRKNLHYLLDSFAVDDLLLEFRMRAGKPIPPSPRKPSKFWQLDLAGSNAGRFLMGAGNTVRWMDDPELRKRLDEVVDGIAACRQSDGYIMAYPEDTIFYSERGAYTRAWLTHGLIEAGYAGNAKAFELLRGNYNWFNRCKYLADLLRGAVQGGQGMIANTRMYFTPAGKPSDMQVIQRYFLEDKWLEDLASMDEKGIWQYPYDRPHCYLLTNLEAYMDLYLATGDPRWYDGVKAGWEMYRDHWEQMGSSISIIEYQYNPPDSNSLTKKLGELCGSSFWVFLSQRFHFLHPEEERYAAEIEKSIYNVALAHQDGSYGLRYHTDLVGYKEKGTRINTCCEGQGTRLIGSLPEHIYSIASDGIYVNLFEPSEISWKQEGKPMQLHMETKFPYANDVKLIFTGDQPTPMKLRIRMPSWAVRKIAVRVNQGAPASGEPGSYLTLNRIWSNGDTIRFALPAGFRLARYTGADQIAGHRRYALTYGPLLYAFSGPQDAVLRVTKGSRAEDMIGQFRRKPDAPLHFTIEGNPGIVAMPFWQIDKEEFTCFPAIEASGDA